jgi:16S rRNA (guanine527-N7)-methyltransferase
VSKLAEVLARAQELGFIGVEPIDQYIDHSKSHLDAACLSPTETWCDLGSGGGIPGLVVASIVPELELVLIDRGEKRVSFLESAIEILGYQNRVKAVLGDATELAHLEKFRGKFDGIFSRSFGTPAIVAECSAGLLKRNGKLVVSEPPVASNKRWPLGALRELGFTEVKYFEGPPRFVSLLLGDECPVSRPRTWKKVSKNPLY